MGLVFGYLGNRKPGKLKGRHFQFYPYCYEQDYHIYKFRLIAMDFSGWLSEQSKPGKPKAHLSQFERTALYRTFILANLG
jgi:hypothetical protein